MFEKTSHSRVGNGGAGKSIQYQPHTIEAQLEQPKMPTDEKNVVGEKELVPKGNGHRLLGRILNLRQQIRNILPARQSGKVFPLDEDVYLIYLTPFEDNRIGKPTGKAVHKYTAVGGEDVISDEGLKELVYQIKVLYRQIARFIPVEEALRRIEIQRKLRGSTTLGKKSQSPIPKPEEDANKENLLDRLQKLENQVRPKMPKTEVWEVSRKLQMLQNELTVAITLLKIELIGQINTSKATSELVECDIDQIGYKDLKVKAKSHCEVIRNLLAQLDPNELMKEGISSLNDKTYTSISNLAEIEGRRSEILLLKETNNRVSNTVVFTVIVYIVLAILLMVAVIYAVNQAPPVSEGLLNQKIPLIGIPWPVILWSLIGSFAAMIHQFNTHPIYDFSEAIKWMLTRPMQGIVLGCAVYLILVSGSFLINGALPTSEPQIRTSEELILILSFFVGFSDRFADSVFNLLLRNYSISSKKEEASRSEPGSQQL